jgi:hypothetical protein
MVDRHLIVDTKALYYIDSIEVFELNTKYHLLSAQIMLQNEQFMHASIATPGRGY